MGNLPIRGLGTAGVITDVAPYNLPTTAFSRAKNVRFNNGSVSAGPVFRPLHNDMNFEAKLLFAAPDFTNTGHDYLVVVNKNFKFLSPVGMGGTSWTQLSSTYDVASDLPITTTKLADCIYINRSDQVPLVILSTATSFAAGALANWPSNHRAGVLRSYGDFMLALNTTEAGTNYPNRVRFSDPAPANTVPATWDAADTTNSAGFNDIIGMDTPIVDGAELGSSFLIYSSDQVWSMDFVGGAFIHNFKRVFDDCGVINTDCIVNVDRKHYVFDRDDIYVTDGNTRQSICDGRVRDYIFNGMNLTRSGCFFAFHNSKTEEIYFCYNSEDDTVAIKDPEGRSGYTKCNRAAVYNYREDNWTFQDMPNVVSHCDATVNTSSTYATSSSTYNSTGGTYLDQFSPFVKHPLVMSVSGYHIGTEHRQANGTTLPDAVGRVNTDTIYGLDKVDNGSISMAYDTNISLAPLIERQGLDLDETGASLADYKVINKILPQISTVASDANFTFSFGATDIPNAALSYEVNVTYNSATDYKVDTRMSGRYLSYKVSPTTLKDFSLSGFDVELIVTGKR